jgi:hypothetical protein
MSMVGGGGQRKTLGSICLICPFLENFSSLLGVFDTFSIWQNQEYFEGMTLETFQSSCWYRHLQSSPAARDYEHWGMCHHVVGVRAI